MLTLILVTTGAYHAQYRALEAFSLFNVILGMSRLDLLHALTWILTDWPQSEDSRCSCSPWRSAITFKEKVKHGATLSLHILGSAPMATNPDRRNFQLR